MHDDNIYSLRELNPSSKFLETNLDISEYDAAMREREMFQAVSSSNVNEGSRLQQQTQDQGGSLSDLFTDHEQSSREGALSDDFAERRRERRRTRRDVSHGSIHASDNEYEDYDQTNRNSRGY